MTNVRKTKNYKNKKYVTGVPNNPAYFVSSTQEPRRWPFLSSFLRTQNKSLTILDVGCGSGSVLLGLFNDGYKNVWGIEYCEELSQLLVLKNPSLRILNGNAENLKDFSECFFDVVYCCAVLEHLPNPDTAVGEAFRVLKKGGAYIINVPNGYSFNDIILSFLQRLLYGQTEHLQKFSLEKICNLLQQRGFKVIEVNPYIGSIDLLMDPRWPRLIRNYFYPIMKKIYKQVLGWDILASC